MPIFGMTSRSKEPCIARLWIAKYEPARAAACSRPTYSISWIRGTRPAVQSRQCMTSGLNSTSSIASRTARAKIEYRRQLSL